MPTIKKPTKAQNTAAGLVRDYFRSNHMDTEDDVLQPDGNIFLSYYNRDENDIADEEPNQAILDQFKQYATYLRALSPLVFVSLEVVDEWVHLEVTVRPKPRKPRPSEILSLRSKVCLRLTDVLKDHPQVLSVRAGHSRDWGGCVTVTTDIDGPIGKRCPQLGWRLDGNSVEGWELIVEWGAHRITRTAAFKKLTPKIILAQLAAITGKLDDLLDCLGHTITVKKDGGWAMTMNGREPATFLLSSVLERDDKTVRAPNEGHTVVFTNNLTGAVTECAVGTELPEKLRNLNLK